MLSKQISFGTVSLFICLVSLLPLQLTHGQTSSSTATTSTTTATSAEEVLNSESNTVNKIEIPADSSWYRKESISGNNVQVGDFVVGPGKMELTIKPGETVTKMITVTNRISDNRSFTLGVEDMSGSADPSKSVVLLGDAKGPYTLKDDISFVGDTITLNLGERALIPVTITMPPNAQPGGYYGSVLVSTIQDKNAPQESSDIQSPIIARVGTLFFITVPGDVEKAGSVTKFSTIGDKWWFQNGPVNLGILFENSGSVYLNPYGEIRISNILGEEVGFVEVDPWFVLPKSLRLREIIWDRELLLGRYEIKAKINRGYDDIVDEKVFYIWVLPWKIIAGLLAIVFIVVFGIRFIFSRFEFKRKG